MTKQEMPGFYLEVSDPQGEPGERLVQFRAWQIVGRDVGGWPYFLKSSDVIARTDESWQTDDEDEADPFVNGRVYEDGRMLVEFISAALFLNRGESAMIGEMFNEVWCIACSMFFTDSYPFIASMSPW